MDKASVIIPTYNRFTYLLNAINSVKRQTFKNIEIIIINDCSTQKEYYEYNFADTDIKITIIHLKENSKSLFGFACPGGYQRNFGINIATGNYIAFLDDDDIWLPNKLELQIKYMKESGCKMSCTDGYIGSGIYNEYAIYQKYNNEYYYNSIQQIYKNAKSEFVNNGFPTIWNYDFLKIHNCCICSSVVIDKDIIDKVGKFIISNTDEDYEYWLRVLKYTNIVYINDTCFYYDLNHGNGLMYEKCL